MKRPLHPSARIQLHYRTQHHPEGRVRLLEIRQHLTGPMSGFEAVAYVELIDGEPMIRRPVELHPLDPVPLRGVGARALKSLHMDNPIEIAQQLLPKLGEGGLEWLDAIRAGQKRPGKRGRAPIELAEVARVRVDAYERGITIRQLVRERPDLFTSEKSAHARIFRARQAEMLAGSVSEGFRLTELAKQTLKSRDTAEVEQ